MLSPAPHRRLMVLRGTPQETQAQARHLLAALPSDGPLWVGGDHPDAVPVAQVRRRLGQSHDAVVLDGHAGLDPDALGRCHGFVRGGGALVVCLPPADQAPRGWRHRLVVPPFTAADVGDHTQRRLARVLSEHATPPAPLTPPARETRGTAQQAQVVDALRAAFRAPHPSLAALVADRGRGKSSALGLALQGLDPAEVVVCGPQQAAVAEVLRFAGQPLAFATPDTLILGDQRPRIIVVDEAAQVPVPALQRLVHAHPQAHLAFATTTHGYEGTGRGFVLRFLRWLEGQGRPVRRLTLTDPIRWAPGDPLEAAVFQALLLDAEPAPVDGPVDPQACVHEVLDRGALAERPQDLRDFFGILVHAHYRTTPGDLQRMLDAPNLRMHALRHRGRIVAASWIALEGGLGPDWVDTVYWGRAGVRGHALPETLVCHGGHREAAALRYIRSVRIAAHPQLRRLGLGRRLVDAVHATYQPDLFGTLFGATPPLLAFRRSVGYQLARLGVSAGSRTGEPAAVMLRAASPAGAALLAELRGELARDLPLQLELMQAGARMFLDPALVAACLHPLPAPAPMPPAERDRAVGMVAFGARPFEAAAEAVRRFCVAHRAHLPALPAEAQALIRARVFERAGWVQVQAAAGLPSVRTTMRALRRALQALVRVAAPEQVPP